MNAHFVPVLYLHLGRMNTNKTALKVTINTLEIYR